MVLVLSISLTISPTRAGMTEVVVGATVLTQVAQVVTELLPQLAALGTSLMGLKQAGEELAGTGNRILQLFFGSSKKSNAKPKKIEFATVPVIHGPSDSAPATGPTTDIGLDAAIESDDDLEASLSKLVVAYRDRAQPTALSHGAPAGPAASLTRGESWETLSESTSHKLLDTVRGGESRRIDRFVKAVQKLAPEDRAAVAPAIEQTVKKGSRFAKLHGDDKGMADGFKSLKALLK